MSTGLNMLSVIWGYIPMRRIPGPYGNFVELSEKPRSFTTRQFCFQLSGTSVLFPPHLCPRLPFSVFLITAVRVGVQPNLLKIVTEDAERLFLSTMSVHITSLGK